MCIRDSYGLERALHGAAADTWASVIDEVVAEALATAPPGVYVCLLYTSRCV